MQIVEAGLATGDHHMARLITQIAKALDNLRGAELAPAIGFVGAIQHRLFTHFTSRINNPGMTGIAPGAAHRATLQANKDGGQAGKDALPPGWSGKSR